MRRHLVAVGERCVLAQLEGVGQAVGRDDRQRRREVRHDREVAVISEQAVEQVVGDLRLGFGVDHRGVERADFVLDGKAEGLVRGEGRGRRRRGGCVRARRDQEADERGGQRVTPPP